MLVLFEESSAALMSDTIVSSSFEICALLELDLGRGRKALSSSTACGVIENV
jgi:hypothetical protein